MQVATPKPADLHAPWSADDQALLDILLLPDDVKTPDESQPASPVVVAPTQNQIQSQTQKLSTVERRARHREVVKRAYHRNKAAIKGLRDTVQQLETQLQKLSLTQAKPAPPTDVQRCYALLTTEQDALGDEAARLRLLLSYRQQFASNMATLAQRATSIASDDSDASDTDSDTATASSTASSPSASPAGAPLAARDLSPLWKTPLAVAMRKQLGYRPLSFADATALVNDMYRSILAFSLSGRAISSGASILGWEDKRLLDGTGLKFSLRKLFVGQNALQLMTSTWQCFSDPECTETKFRGLMTLRILQRVNDDTIVALRESSSEDGTKLYRCVYLLFRVRTRKGFLICVQSVAPERLTDPALSSISRDGKPVQWTELSGWFVFEPTLEGDGNGQFYEESAQVEYGGCMDYGDHESVATLAMNTLSIVFKWESMMVSPIFTLPPSSW
ncbi:hypothetical protein KRP22_008095 [Phytophthora ramorum]|nr:hypothetical protein KRP22_3895 [Phytophthora ramorum]